MYFIKWKLNQNHFKLQHNVKMFLVKNKLFLSDAYVQHTALPAFFQHLIATFLCFLITVYCCLYCFFNFWPLLKALNWKCYAKKKKKSPWSLKSETKIRSCAILETTTFQSLKSFYFGLRKWNHSLQKTWQHKSKPKEEKLYTLLHWVEI